LANEQSNDQILRSALRANSWVAGVLGALVLLAAGPLALSLGLTGPFGFGGALFAVFATGIAFYAFSAILSETARSPAIDERAAFAALLLNAAWVVGSIGFLLVPLTLSAEGRWLVQGLALVAAGFAAVQAYGIWRARMSVERDGLPAS